METNKIRKHIGSPISNKVFGLSQLYWQCKTQFYYRFLFKKLGPGSILRQPMLIYNADCIEIGDNVSIRDGVRLEAIRDSYGRIPSLTIGDNALIEQGVQIICHNRVAIGRDVSIAGRCAIVDVTHPYKDVRPGNIGNYIADENSFVEIGDGAFLGYGAVILPNVRVGKRAVIGANSVVTEDVPEFSIVAGSPAKIIRIYSHELQEWVKPAVGTPAR